MPEPFGYRAFVTGVLDGDTLRADVDLGFFTWVRDQVFRLAGIDTPESHARDPAVRAEAVRAAVRLRQLVFEKPVRIRTEKDRREKYGRYLARIFLADGAADCVNDRLVAEGLARPYASGPRVPAPVTSNH